MADPTRRQGVPRCGNARKVAQANGDHDTLGVHSLTRVQGDNVLVTLAFEPGDHLVLDVWHELLLYFEAIFGECLEFNGLIIFQAALSAILLAALAARRRDGAATPPRPLAPILR